jgi:tetratricopeptide (TPR) repeat protein
MTSRGIGPHPDEERLHKLVKLADGLLIWAATVCTLVSTEHSNKGPLDILDEILLSSSIVSHEERMEDLYREALKRIFPTNDDGSRLKLFHSMVALREVLPLTEFARLVKMRPKFIQTICSHLTALQTRGKFDDSTVQPAVQLFHTSFIEHLGQLKEVHRVMADNCIHFFKQVTGPDVAKGSQPFQFQEAERYVGDHWMYHLREAPLEYRLTLLPNVSSNHLCLGDGCLLSHLQFRGEKHGYSSGLDAPKTMSHVFAYLPGYFNNLGSWYLSRFRCIGNLQDIDLAISHHKNAVDSTPSGHADLPSWFNSLGNSHLCRFECTGDLQDIDHAISYHQSAIESTPSGHADLPGYFNSIGSLYLSHFRHTGNSQDIDHAISYHKSAVESTPSSHADFPGYSNNLGSSLLFRFRHTGNLQDIDHAISCHKNAVESTPPSHANLLGYFNNLGSSYLSRFKRTSNLQDIELAISFHKNSVESTSSGHADLPNWFHNLGNSHLCRFERTGDLQDIDYAISYHQSAIESTPSGHADLPGYFNSIGNSYLSYFRHTGNLRDIDHAIFCHKNAVESTPSSHADLPSWFHSLGNSHLYRFEYTGDLQDIDHAISYHQSAIRFTPPGHVYLSGYFNSLGSSYLSRFKCTSNLQDIEHAITHHQNAVDSTPLDHADLPSYFNNLGNSYLSHFKHIGNLQDIDYAISCHKNGVNLTPSGHADLPRQFNSLGNSHLCRFGCTGDLQDINYAMFYHQNAIECTPSGHAYLSGYFNSLGSSYLSRFKCTGNLQDIDHAITHYQNAVESTPSGHADLSHWYNDLGQSYQLRFQSNHYFHDIQNGIASYRSAAKENGTPSIRLESARLAATLSSDKADPCCLNDFALAISLLSELAGLEQTIHRRYANLHCHSELVGSAVATALRFNEPSLALEWLEQGRCLVWTQFDQLRTPIDALHMKAPFLANDFIRVSSALEFHGTHSILSIPSSHATLAEDVHLQDNALKHTLIATEYRHLLKEIRALPDFYDFLQPPKATNLLSSLPFDGPVIIFSMHNTRCDALALIAGMMEPLHIPLENFHLVQAKELQKTLSQLNSPWQHHRGGRKFQDVQPTSSILFVLKELWCKLVQPILEALGYSVRHC